MRVRAQEFVCAAGCEFVLAVGDCTDNTLELIEGIGSPKIKIIHTIWDESIREGGKTVGAGIVTKIIK